MPRIRQAVDAGEQLPFAIAQGRLHQARRGHEPHFTISLGPPDLEKAVRLLVSRD
jgi:hypothetical protein